MLELTDHEPLSPLELIPPARRKSPTIAFLLSLLWPGIGHLYLLEFKKAAWLISMQFIGIAFIAGNGRYALQGWLMVPALYTFGFADAYHSAREWNAGASDRFIGTSPRIAALLNFLTKGFGYFYLGDRAKGVICFFAVTILQLFLVYFKKPWLTALSFSVQAALAVDVYRIARERLLSTNPELTGDAVAHHNQGGLPTQVPVVLGILVFCAIFAAFGSVVLLSGRAVHHNGKVEIGEDGLHYRDDERKISLSAPSEWESRRVEDALIGLSSGNCNVILMEQRGIESVETVRDGVISNIVAKHPEAVTTKSSGSLAGRYAAVGTMSYRSGGKNVAQKYLLARRGLSSFSVIETAGDGEDCDEDFAKIEKSVSF